MLTHEPHHVRLPASQVSLIVDANGHWKDELQKAGHPRYDDPAAYPGRVDSTPDDLAYVTRIALLCVFAWTQSLRVIFNSVFNFHFTGLFNSYSLHPLPSPLCSGLLEFSYVVMSSGTTGVPKGIMCPHRGAVHSYHWRHEHYPLRPDDRAGCAVFFVWEVFRPLMRGLPTYVGALSRFSFHGSLRS